MAPVSYIITILSNYYVLLLLTSFWFWLVLVVVCPCMAITGKNVCVQYNGGLLPDIYNVNPMLLASGNPFNGASRVWAEKNILGTKY